MTDAATTQAQQDAPGASADGAARVMASLSCPDEEEEEAAMDSHSSVEDGEVHNDPDAVIEEQQEEVMDSTPAMDGPRKPDIQYLTKPTNWSDPEDWRGATMMEFIIPHWRCAWKRDPRCGQSHSPAWSHLLRPTSTPDSSPTESGPRPGQMLLIEVYAINDSHCPV